MADDSGPQADRDHVPVVDPVFLFRRRDDGAARSHGASDSQTDHHDGRAVQPGVYAARHHHGVSIHHPFGSGRARELCAAADARGEGRRVSTAESVQSVYLLDRMSDGACGDRAGRSRYRLDILYSVFDDNGRSGEPDGAGSLRAGIFLDFHRNQLHRHDS